KLLAFPLQAGRTAAGRSQSVNYLRQIGLAMHNFHDVYSHFPPQAIRSREGKPLLSWRVAILPYIEQDHLYKQFHLDEPWDSEHNKQLLARMPDIFRASSQPPGSTDTYYQGFTGRGTIFERGREVRFADITDGMSNTILVIEGGP